MPKFIFNFNRKALLAALAVLLCWSGAAAADLFYVTTDDAYHDPSGGVVQRKDSGFEVFPDVLANLGQVIGPYPFIGPDGRQMLLISSFTYSPDDGISIYDMDKEDWAKQAPVFNSTAWKGTNLKGVCVVGDYLYVAAAVHDYVSSVNQKSGEIIKVSMSDYKAVDKYTFPEHPDGVTRHIVGIKAHNGKILAVSSPYTSTNYKAGEVFQFDPANIGGGPIGGVGRKVEIGKGPGGMSQPVAVFGGKLFIGCNGRAQDNEAGAFWAVDFDSLSASKVLDLADLDTGADDKKAFGLAFAQDGAAILLVENNWLPGVIYFSTAEKLLNPGLSAAEKAGTRAQGFTPGEIYTFAAQYDAQNKMFWVSNGKNLEAWSADGKRTEVFEPARLGNNIYDIAAIGSAKTSAAGGGDGSGGGCSAGTGAALSVAAFIAAAFIIRRAGRDWR